MLREEEFFSPGDIITWRDDDELENTKGAPEDIGCFKNMYGPGPFVVLRATELSIEQMQRCAHSQYITFLPKSEKSLCQSESPESLSGFWFKKVSSAKTN
ncbi:MAG: hypothetical protein KGJ89_03435 [Patescibacteria group bacterium]|nr:hypothetical protein [Patescibacteria group bacterium]MDE2015401.1 hypothetical protein [Patescibacteria group bacterium]MDE2226984.1 hypothetical protein [Patescibacteria group bacterium]